MNYDDMRIGIIITYLMDQLNVKHIDITKDMINELLDKYNDYTLTMLNNRELPGFTIEITKGEQYETTD